MSKKELLIKSIEELEQELQELRGHKTNEYKELEIMQDNKINLQNRFNEIQKINDDLLLKNKELEGINIGICENITNLNKKEQELSENIKKLQENLNKLDLSKDKLVLDINNLETKKTSIIEENSELINDNLDLRKEIEKNINLKQENKDLELQIFEQKEYLKQENKDFNNKLQTLKEKDRIILLKYNKINKFCKDNNLPFIKFKNE